MGRRISVMKQYDYAKCAKYFRYLFLMIIPGIIVGLFTNEKVIEQYPSVEYVAIACNFILSIVSAYFILQLKTEDDRYRKAAILSIIYAVAVVILQFIDPLPQPVRAVASTITLIIGIIRILTLYPTHADVMAQPAPELAKKWETIKILNLIFVVATYAATVLMFFAPIVAMVPLFAAAVLVIVAGIMELIALNKSYKACTAYAASGRSPEDAAQQN